MRWVQNNAIYFTTIYPLNHLASHYGNLAVATLLLDRGADVNFQAKHNITPLHGTNNYEII